MSDHHRFVGSAKLIAGLTLASRVLGVMREMVFSHFFGATPLFGDFRFAFQLPNLARKLFGEGALSSSFIPVFTKTREADGEDAAQRLAGGVLAMLTAVLSALLVLVEIGLFAVGWFGWTPVLSLTAIMMPYMVLICVTAFLGGALNVLNRFAAPAIAPMILNVVNIAATWCGGRWLALPPESHLTLVAWSVILSGGLQVGLQLWWLQRIGFAARWNFDWSSPAVRRVMKLMGPLMLGVSAVQFNTFADSLISYLMVPDGRGLSILGYAQYMNNLPLGIFATALATAIFPMLAQRLARRDRAGFADAVEMGMRTSLFIAIPAGAGLILIAEPLVRVLFEHGAFNSNDTPRVARALSYYCLGMWAYSLQQILVRAFYSMEDNRTPVRISVAMLCLNFVLNIVLVLTPLWESGVALATAITGTLQAILLAVALRKRLRTTLPWRATASTAIRSAGATAVMVAALWVMRGTSPLGPVLPGGEKLQLVMMVAIGALAYAALAKLLGLRELAVLLGRSAPRP